jgi:hypothetical protein
MGKIRACLLILLAAGLAQSSGQEDGDLVAVESRYKVVAKPEPYKPPRPAPDDLEITTRRGLDGAEVIYPTTTYRPVNLYLPTKGSEKFLHNFGKTGDKRKPSSEELSDSSESATKDKSGGSKKRIKKVRKVLRNSAARKQKSSSAEAAEKKRAGEVRSLLPTVKPHRPPPTTSRPPTTTTERPAPKRSEDKPLFQHPGDIDVRTNKKARGLVPISRISVSAEKKVFGQFFYPGNFGLSSSEHYKEAKINLNIISQFLVGMH